MNLSYLMYFIEACNCGSIQGASKKLFVSSQGLGQGIQRLEKSVGIQLLERTPLGVKPTEFGLCFYEQACIVYREMQKLDLLAENYRCKKQTNIVIATLGKNKFHDGIKVCADDYMREYPERMLNISVRSCQTSEELFAGVRGGEIDIAWMFHWKEHPDLQYFTVSNYSRLMLLTCADNPLASRNSVSWEQLKSLRFVIAGENDPYTDLTKALCKSHGFLPKFAYYSTENNMIASLIDNNSASILLRECYYRVISQFCKNARVIPLVPEVYVANSLIIRAKRRQNKEARKLLKYMIDYFKYVMGMGLNSN